MRHANTNRLDKADADRKSREKIAGRQIGSREKIAGQNNDQKVLTRQQKLKEWAFKTGTSRVKFESDLMKNVKTKKMTEGQAQQALDDFDAVMSNTETDKNGVGSP